MLNTIKQYFTTTNSINFTHKWTIENFSHLYVENHPWKWRICAHNELYEFGFYLYPKGYTETWKDYVSIGVGGLNIPRKYDGKIRCRWRVSIEDENGEKCETKENYCLFSARGKVMLDFIQYTKLLNNPEKYLPQDQLTLYFEIYLEADDRIFNVIRNNEMGWSRFDCANKVTKVEHTWTIENFVDLYVENADVPYFIQSDHFPALEQHNELFCLKLYPNGYNEKISKDSVDIVIWNDNENSTTVHWRLSIFDVDNEEFDTREGTGTIPSNEGRIFEYNRSSLFDNSNGTIENNKKLSKLKIHCEMSYMINSIENKKTGMQSQMSIDFVHKSESHFNGLLKTAHQSKQFDKVHFNGSYVRVDSNSQIGRSILLKY